MSLRVVAAIGDEAPVPVRGWRGQAGPCAAAGTGRSRPRLMDVPLGRLWGWQMIDTLV
jgi:hypothetical protein